MLLRENEDECAESVKTHRAAIIPNTIYVFVV